MKLSARDWVPPIRRGGKWVHPERQAQADLNGQAAVWRTADAAEYAAYYALRALADDSAWVGQDSRASDLDDRWEGLAGFEVERITGDYTDEPFGAQHRDLMMFHVRAASG